MYDYVSPEKLMSALRWRKANNPSYVEVEVNEDWFEQSVADDCDLIGGLVRQAETNNFDCENSDHELTPQDDNSASHSDTMECETSLTTSPTLAQIL